MPIGGWRLEGCQVKNGVSFRFIFSWFFFLVYGQQVRGGGIGGQIFMHHLVDIYKILAKNRGKYLAIFG